MWLHNTFKNHVWLWRGQANYDYGVEPGIHTRVLASSDFPNSEDSTRLATAALLDSAREMRLDRMNENRLPDLAMLAHLQHYGAATPLLDVTTDPLIALWMIAFADPKNPASHDDKSGSLFAIKKPPKDRWISSLDARPYLSNSFPSVADGLGESVWWFQAPDVTERLRIQRGSFIVGHLARSTDRKNTTLPLNLASTSTNALADRLENKGQSSKANIGNVELFRIAVQPAVKPALRRLLEERSGLSIEAIYPTPWHRPYIEQFARTYDRERPLKFDIKAAPKPLMMTPPIQSEETQSAG